jgi:hypothetical protein
MEIRWLVLSTACESWAELRLTEETSASLESYESCEDETDVNIWTLVSDWFRRHWGES